jgi:hypothetical protein
MNMKGMPRTMLGRIRLPKLFSVLLLLSLVQLPASNAQNVEPFKFLRDYVGLKEDQIAAIRNGKAVAKVVESGTPDEVFVFGSVYVQSTPEKYLKFASAGALSHSHWIWMLALLVVWRILMDYGIAPRVMGHELEIHPLLAIFTLMVGGAVARIVGIYLSVPLVAALRVIYRRFASPPVGATVPGSIVDRPEPRRETSVMA